MKLEDITSEMLKRAVDIYVAVAYERKPLPFNVKSRIEFLREHAGDDLKQVLSHKFVERVVSEEDPEVVDVYAVRLGNDAYPHMKLALQRKEGDDYHLVVEAHDRHFELETADPDAPKAEQLKAYNRRLKEEIETRWRETDLPTLEA